VVPEPTSISSEDRALILSRRNALRLGAVLLVTPLAGLRAQDFSGYTKEWFSSAVKTFEAANTVLTKGDPRALPDVDALMQYLATDFRGRVSSFELARKSGIFVNQDTATSYVRSISKMPLPNLPFAFDQRSEESQIQIIQLCAQLAVPIAPEATSVVPAAIPSIPPAEKKTPETDLQVIGDILLETLGIVAGTEGLMDELLRGDPEIKKILDDLVKAVSTKDWKTVAKIGEQFFKLLVASKIWVAVKQKLGAQLLKRSVFRVALAGVPLVGWAYVVAALLVAIRANYHRFSFA
jgi:hypothetical protein